MKFQLEYLARHTWSFFQFHDGVLQNLCSIVQSLYRGQTHDTDHVGPENVF